MNCIYATAVPDNNSRTTPTIVLPRHNNKRAMDSAAVPIKAAANNEGNKNFQLTRKLVGLLKNNSSGVKHKIIKLAVNENDRIAVSFNFQGVFLIVSRKITTPPHQE